ncbi:MAG: O-antigen ligase family protein [Rhodospirillaceae bacterium]|nr:O-antigen ligase family protein [Rhodospirillaceae bacterium]MBT5039968.1 O-antigen ligase family protein [Rhodospirillaceae bacterium]MBT5674270.1 O-antigen ligase family protein [Rhodospirillaceae bacterium]
MPVASQEGDAPLAPRQHVLALGAAIFAGIGIPLLASSPTVSGVSLALALILLLAAPGRRHLVADFARGARSPLGLAILLTFILWLPGMGESLDSGRSIGVWGRMAGFVFVAALIHHFLSRGALDNCLRALIVASLICALIALLGLYAASPIYGLFRGKGWIDINAAQILKYYGSALACLTPVVLWAGFRLGGRWRIAGIVYLPAAIVLIFAVDSLAGLLGLIAGLAVGAVVGICQCWQLLRGHAAALFLGLLALLLVVAFAWVVSHLPPPPETGQIVDGIYHGPVDTDLPVSLIDAHRQYIWGFAFDKALEAPFFGHGIDVSNYLPGASVLIEKFNQTFIPSHPHSWLLEIFLETGAVGLMMLLLTLVLMLRLWLRVGKTSPGTAACGIAIFVAFWSSSMLNFSIWAAWWQGVFLVLSAIVLAAAARDAETSPAP